MTDLQLCIRKMRQITLYSEQIKDEVETIRTQPLSINNLNQILDHINSLANECYQESFRLIKELSKDD